MSNPMAQDQPMPHPGLPGTTQDAFIELIQIRANQLKEGVLARRAKGEENYNTPGHQVANGRFVVLDALQEIIDAGVYLTGLWQAIQLGLPQLELIIRQRMLTHGIVHEGLVKDLSRALADFALTYQASAEVIAPKEPLL